jgi:hypothetical protein
MEQCLKSHTVSPVSILTIDETELLEYAIKMYRPSGERTPNDAWKDRTCSPFSSLQTVVMKLSEVIKKRPSSLQEALRDLNRGKLYVTGYNFDLDESTWNTRTAYSNT